jgi:hypothetical protein
MRGNDSMVQKLTNKYFFYFSWLGLILFGFQAAPNFFWTLIPPIDNPLAHNSAPNLFWEILEHGLGIILVVLLVTIANRKFEMSKANPKILTGAIVLVFAYYVCWIMYYAGNYNQISLFLMALIPPIYFMVCGFYLKKHFIIPLAFVFGIVHCLNVINQLN